MKGKIIFYAISFFILSSCAVAGSDWEKAQKLDTISSYRRFIKKHPQSEFQPKAEQEIQELFWQYTKNKNTLKSYVRFVNKFPQSKYKPEADKLIWQQVVQLDTLSLYKKFIDKFPQSKFKPKAENIIQELLENDCSEQIINSTINSLPNYDYSSSGPQGLHQIKHEVEVENFKQLMIKCGSLGGNPISDLGRFSLMASTGQLGEHKIALGLSCNDTEKCRINFKIYKIKVLR